MEKVTNNSFLNGSGGALWIDGERLAQVKKVEAKITGQFEDVEVAGDFATYSQYVGYSIEGTVTLQKVNSFVLNKVVQGFKTGEMEESTIITKIENPKTKAVERVSITGVLFTEADLGSFDTKSLMEEEIPFRATDYNVLEAI